jgi:hypothetical protein
VGGVAGLGLLGNEFCGTAEQGMCTLCTARLFAVCVTTHRLHVVSVQSVCVFPFNGKMANSLSSPPSARHDCVLVLIPCWSLFLVQPLVILAVHILLILLNGFWWPLNSA